MCVCVWGGDERFYISCPCARTHTQSCLIILKTLFQNITHYIICSCIAFFLLFFISQFQKVYMLNDYVTSLSTEVIVESALDWPISLCKPVYIAVNGMKSKCYVLDIFWQYRQRPCPVSYTHLDVYKRQLLS